MLIEQFNKKLKEFSQRLTLLRLSRNQLADKEQDIFRMMLAYDQQQKGGFAAYDIMRLWVKGDQCDEKQKLQFVQSLFPFHLASYSVIAKFLIGSSAVIQLHSQNHEIISSTEVEYKIQKIFSLELQNYLETQRIFQDMKKFVPTVYLKPTKGEFYQYVASQQLTIDVESLSKALLLPELPLPKHAIKPSQDFKENLWEPCIQSLQSTMNRLKDRVKIMGNQCFQ